MAETMEEFSFLKLYSEVVDTQRTHRDGLENYHNKNWNKVSYEMNTSHAFEGNYLLSTMLVEQHDLLTFMYLTVLIALPETRYNYLLHSMPAHKTPRLLRVNKLSRSS